MKPVKEIALMLDVSQVTVYNHIKKLKEDIEPYIYDIKGVKHLDNEGIRQIKISMGLLQVPEVRKDISMDHVINEISIQVSKEIKEDYQELKDDNETIREQLNELQEQNKELLDLLHHKENKSLIKRFKGLFKKG